MRRPLKFDEQLWRLLGQWPRLTGMTLRAHFHALMRELLRLEFLMKGELAHEALPQKMRRLAEMP